MELFVVIVVPSAITIESIANISTVLSIVSVLISAFWVIVVKASIEILPLVDTTSAPRVIELSTSNKILSVTVTSPAVVNEPKEINTKLDPLVIELTITLSFSVIYVPLFVDVVFIVWTDVLKLFKFVAIFVIALSVKLSALRSEFSSTSVIEPVVAISVTSESVVINSVTIES